MKFKILLFIAFLMVFPCIKVNAANNMIKEETAHVIVGDVDAPVLSVDIEWGNMEFTLNEETNYSWKDSTKTYELEPIKYSWVANNNYIDVSNNSYKNIEVNLVYNSLNDNIEGVFNKENEIVEMNNTVRFELNLSGKITDSENKVIKVGSIDLLIS